MIEADYQIINEAIKRFSEYYPDGDDWGDAMYEFHNRDYEQCQFALNFLRDNGILVPWGNAEGNRLMLSNVGINIRKQFNGDIIKYLEHKETMKRKAQAEHELEMKVHRSTLKSHIVQNWGAVISVLCALLNIGLVLWQYLK